MPQKRPMPGKKTYRREKRAELTPAEREARAEAAAASNAAYARAVREQNRRVEAATPKPKPKKRPKRRNTGSTNVANERQLSSIEKSGY